MKVKFAAQHPTFGTKHNRKSLSYQQRSPYYWWWAYLRRNEDYLKCCANGGSGKLAELYEDFGDVRSEDFHKWWTEDNRGARLFAEQYRPLFQLNAATEWDSSWDSSNMLVVAVPLQNGVSKRDIQKAFASLLKTKHKAKRGRSTTKWTSSTAKYPISRNYTIESLRLTLSVYDEYMKNQKLKKSQQKTLWEIGVDIRLVSSAMPNAKDDKVDNYEKRNLMAASVSRYLRRAKAIVEGVALGKFPL